jgi:uncharacterized protein YecE (DUF72 family)
MWADRIRAWNHGKPTNFAQTIAEHKSVGRGHKDVFCYFDNDAKVNAPFDAASLMLALEDLPALVEPDVAPSETIKGKANLSKKIRTSLQPRAQNR